MIGSACATGTSTAVLVFGRMWRFEDELLEAVRQRPTGEGVVAAFGRFILTPSGNLAASANDAGEELADLARIVAGSPALQSRETELLSRYTDAMAALITDEVGARPGDPRPPITAHTR